ncbi:hypothetical protein ACHQM5_012140 [Ranunculus cassubicifolius]
MQQGGGGGGAGGHGGGSQYGMSQPVPEMTAAFTAAPATTTSATTHMLQQQQQQLLQHQHHKQGDHAMLVVEGASPISSRPPQRPSPLGNFDELVTAAAASSGSGFPDDEGFDGLLERGGVGGGNRWPRQETMALLKIRSEMDAAFRDATLKGPLWEDVSRKLSQQGYTRSAKKCKEKFENVHKYYKRTKEGRAGRQDGKSYRFFSQLEALHTTTTTSTVAAAATPTIQAGMAGRQQPPVSASPSDLAMPPTSTAVAPPLPASNASQMSVQRIGLPDLSGGIPMAQPAAAAAAAGISFSSNTSSSASEDSEDDLLEEGPSNTTTTTSRKRKRDSSGGGGSRKMMDFFEGLMKQVMEKQEAMQQKFLETIERREQDRMIREEAWKRQEMARLAREHEIMAQERSIAASRDAAIIAFLQKLTGQTIQFPTPVVIPAAPPPAPHSQPPHTPAVPVQQPSQQHHQPQQTPPHPQPQPPQQTPPPQPQPQQHHQHHQPQLQNQNQKPQPQPQPQHHTPQSTEIVRHQPTIPTDVVVAAVPEQQHPPQEMMIGASGGSFDSTSSRWPKQEVLALIKLRSGLESRYQEAGPKGPLWEEISAGMQRMGYNRSSKRCKEKWENINKYFKKVKESNKKRPEDAKTCPYFHQLDALYRRKMLGGGGGSSSSFGHQGKQDDPMAIDPSPISQQSFQAIMPPPPHAQPSQTPETAETKSSNKNGNGGDHEQHTTTSASSVALKKVSIDLTLR